MHVVQVSKGALWCLFAQLIPQEAALEEYHRKDPLIDPWKQANLAADERDTTSIQGLMREKAYHRLGTRKRNHAGTTRVPGFLVLMAWKIFSVSRPLTNQTSIPER